MLGQIFKVSSFAIISLSLCFFILIAGCTSSDAVLKGWVPPEENSLTQETNIDFDNGKDTIENSIDDLFGSEQVFPFEPGLGNQSSTDKGITGGSDVS